MSPLRPANHCQLNIDVLPCAQHAPLPPCAKQITDNLTPCAQPNMPSPPALRPANYALHTGLRRSHLGYAHWITHIRREP
jgi:hypothetical protein